MRLFFIILLGFCLGILIGLVYNFFKRPKNVPYSPYSPEKYVTLDGLKVHYVQEGSGPDLVLIHGIGASLQSWRWVFQLLKKSFRVTALDLTGFGESERDPQGRYGLDDHTHRLLQFLNALKIQKAHFVGASMGGGISLWLSKLAPERVQSLALLAPAADHKVTWINPDYFIWLGHLLKNWFVSPGVIRIAYSKALGDKKFLTKTAVLYYYRPYWKYPETVIAFLKSVHALRDKRLPDELHDIRQPCLIIYGERDRVLPRKSVEKIQKVISHSKVLYHKSGGHQVMEEDPQFIVEEINKFVSSLAQLTKV